MFKVLIIDDELLICKGLKSMIERSNHENIGDVYYSTNPIEALDMIEQIKPEIIFTDIRMPGLNGLELIKKVNAKESYRYKFIILSGYDDFAYVKESFMLGVIDYLLKPIMMEELSAILSSAADLITEEEQLELSIKSQASKINQAVMENRLNRLFSGVDNYQAGIKELFTDMGISFRYGSFIIGLLVFYGNTGREYKKEIQTRLDMAIAMKQQGMDIYPFYNNMNNLVLLFNIERDKLKGEVNSFLSDFTGQLSNDLKIVSSASTSEIVKGNCSIMQLYQQAKEASAYRILYGPSRIIEYSLVRNIGGKQLLFDRQLQSVKESIATYKTMEISNIIDELFNHNSLKNQSIQTIHWLYSGIIHIINDFAISSDFYPVHKNYEDFYGFDYLSDIKIYLKTIVFDLIASLKERNKSKTVADIAKKYIDENYHSEIDMTVVSNMVSISYSHFSKLFKDEVGMNFTDYLTKVRMEKALELLNDPNNRIQDIAEMVGYNNPKNFTRAFRNYFDFSPSRYRENL